MNYLVELMEEGHKGWEIYESAYFNNYDEALKYANKDNGFYMIWNKELHNIQTGEFNEH